MTVATKTRLVAAVVVLAVVLVGACTPDSTEVATSTNEPTAPPAVPSSSTPSTEAPSETQPAVGTLPAAHPLEVLDGADRLDGSVFDLAAHAEDLPTVVWLWAPWCPDCHDMARVLAEVTAEYEGRLTVVGVADQAGFDRVGEFVEDTGARSIVHLVDTDGTIFQRYGIEAVPTLLLVTPDGEVSEIVGDQTRAAMVEHFDALLAP